MPSTQPSKFELLLSYREAKAHMLSRFPFRWLRVELMGAGTPYFGQLGLDMKQFHETHTRVRRSLAETESAQATTAAHWSSFLKQRVEIIDFWLSFLTTLGVIASAGFALLAFQAQAQNEKHLVLGGISAILALVVAVYNFELNRRKTWYKYLIAHLDAIK